MLSKKILSLSISIDDPSLWRDAWACGSNSPLNRHSPTKLQEAAVRLRSVQHEINEGMAQWLEKTCRLLNVELERSAKQATQKQSSKRSKTPTADDELLFGSSPLLSGNFLSASPSAKLSTSLNRPNISRGKSDDSWFSSQSEWKTYESASGSTPVTIIIKPGLESSEYKNEAIVSMLSHIGGLSHMTAPSVIVKNGSRYQVQEKCSGELLEKLLEEESKKIDGLNIQEFQKLALFTLLLQFHDGREANFLVAQDSSGRWVLVTFDHKCILNGSTGSFRRDEESDEFHPTYNTCLTSLPQATTALTSESIKWLDTHAPRFVTSLEQVGEHKASATVEHMYNVIREEFRQTSGISFDQLQKKIFPGLKPLHDVWETIEHDSKFDKFNGSILGMFTMLIQNGYDNPGKLMALLERVIVAEPQIAGSATSLRESLVEKLEMLN